MKCFQSVRAVAGACALLAGPFLGCPAPFANEVEIEADLAKPPPPLECGVFERVRTSEIEGPLKREQFGTLDARLREIQTMMEREIACEERGREAFRKFNHRHDWMRVKLDGWVEAMPDSWVAHSARAIHLVSLGWEQRTTRRAKGTSAEQFERMRESFAEAEPDIRRAIELHPKHLLPYEQAIYIAMGSGPREAAKRAVELALEQEPRSLQIRLVYLVSLRPDRGGSLRAMEQFSEEAQRHAHENPQLRWLLGYADEERAQIAWRKEKITEAAQHFEKALEHGNFFSWLRDAVVLWDDVGNLPNTVRAANRLLEHYPNNAQALRLRGKAYVEFGNVERGLIDLDRALEIAPNDYGVATDRAYVFRALRRFEEAEQAFRRVLEIEPNDEWALRGLGHVLVDRVRRPDEVEEIRQRLAALDTGGS